MAKAGSFWKCSKCGNVVVVVKQGKNPKVGCCNMPMKMIKKIR
ncbi:MAG TPA: desulforedoxin [Candidatus Binatia bacterium]|nr:desulforedoxin [Candidatus Binatia bacterium]